MAVFLSFTPVMAADTPAADEPLVETPAAGPVESVDKTEALKAMQQVVDNARANVAAEPDASAPTPPAIIQAAARRGAQYQYIGTRNGFSGWIILEGGAPAFVYVSEDEQTIFRGLMFDAKGQPVTIAQTTEAQIRNPEFFGLSEADIAAAQKADSATSSSTTSSGSAAATVTDNRTPDQVLYDALGVSNYFVLGSDAPTAPMMYAFFDPDCPHCKQFLKSIDETFIKSGKVQLRMIPIGIISPESKARAAYLLAQANPGDLLMKHVRGEQELPVQKNITLDGQQLNLDLFRLWRMDGTPLFVFKDKNGTVMMVRGEPNNMDKLIEQVASGGVQ